MLRPRSISTGCGLVGVVAACALAFPVASQAPAGSPAKPPTAVTPERWLSYEGRADRSAVGDGAHIVLVAAEQEYRAEQALPMLARLLSTRHGFRCTVLFSQKDGLVDPTQETRSKENPEMFHDIPGMELLASADLLVLFTRFMALPDEQLAHLNTYLDSGKPLIGIRTANHGFQGNWTYRLNGKKVRFGDDVLGGAFRGHHGGWHREATRGVVVDENKEHPILRGVDDVFGPSDVYRTYPGDRGLPAGCTSLLLGQPLQSLAKDAAPNTNKEPLPIAWTKTWTGNQGKTARVFHVTMGSARDFQSAGLRRLLLNASLWCLEREEQIQPTLSVELVGPYAPKKAGFQHAKLGVAPQPVSHYR
ncbi:MAG: ThuA domain-containing protein [Planctomycetota bacterium]